MSSGVAEDLKNILIRFDKNTIEYLEANKNEIFKSIASNNGIPQEEIGVVLAGIHAQRAVLVEAVEKMEKLKKE